MPYSTKCFRIQLKPHSIDRVREWARTLNESRRDEALATLRDEDVVLEAAFLDQTPAGAYLIYVMTAQDFARAKQVGAASTHAIDEYHRRFKSDTWDSRVELESLLDLTRIHELGP